MLLRDRKNSSNNNNNAAIHSRIDEAHGDHGNDRTIDKTREDERKGGLNLHSHEQKANNGKLTTLRDYNVI